MSNISFTNIKRYQFGGIPVFLCETDDKIPDYISLTSDDKADIFGAMTKIYCMGTTTGIIQYDSKPSETKLMSYYHISERSYVLAYYDNENIITIDSGFNAQSTSYNDVVWPALCIVIKKGDSYYVATNNTYAIFKKPLRPTYPINWTSASAPTSDSLGSAFFETFDKTSSPFQFFSGYASINNDFGKWLEKQKEYNPDDPYENIGDVPDDPGQGDFDYGSDDIPVPDLPETNVTDSGLVSLFAPDEGQLKQLASFLWSDAFSLDSFKKIFNNPMDCILGLSILPIHLPHGGAKEITVGNIVSTVSCDVCSAQYVKLNCGTFTFSRSHFTGGYLDNAPYTRVYLYLPFIGCQEINIDEFMGTTLGVEYHIDILTGAMFCFVTRNGNLLLTYSGNCAENVPLSANDFTSTISSMLSMATIGAGAIATIATAGATAPATVGMASEALGARTASSLVGAGAQGASAVMSSKPNTQHSGSLGGGAGAMGELYPYLIFIAPRADIPTDQNAYTGFPSNKITKIGNLKGFNVIEAVNLKVEGANDTEMSEIESILKGGVII